MTISFSFKQIIPNTIPRQDRSLVHIYSRFGLFARYFELRLGRRDILPVQKKENIQNMARQQITPRQSSLILNFLLLLIAILLIAPISLSRPTTRIYPTIDRRESNDTQPPGGKTHIITVGRVSIRYKPTSHLTHES